MKKVRVIAAKHMPVRWPTIATIVWGLLLDRFHAPGWAWGIYATLAVILWILSIITFCLQAGAEPSFKD